jgi:hypothetical protein
MGKRWADTDARTNRAVGVRQRWGVAPLKKEPLTSLEDRGRLRESSRNRLVFAGDHNAVEGVLGLHFSGPDLNFEFAGPLRSDADHSNVLLV